jgi:hypothetical protein
VNRTILAVTLALLVAGCGGENEEPAVAVGEIRCSNTRLTVPERVAARPDGVHLDVRVSGERGVSLELEGQRVRGPVVLPLATGGHRVKCNHRNGGSMEAGFEVVAAN